MRRPSLEWSERDDSSPDPIDLLSPEKPIPRPVPAPAPVPPRRPPPLQSRGSPRTWPETPVTAGPSSYRHQNQNQYQTSHPTPTRYSPKKRTPRVILSPSRSAPSSPSDEDTEEQVKVALKRNNHKRRRVLSNSDSDDGDYSSGNHTRPKLIDIKGGEASRGMVSRSRSPRKGPADSSAIPEESEQEQESFSSSPRQHDGDMTVQMDVRQSSTPPHMPSPPDTSNAPIPDVPIADAPLIVEAGPPLNVDPAATLGPIDAAEAAELPASLDLRDIASPPAGQFGSDDPPSSPVHLDVAVSAEAKTDEGDALEEHDREEASPPAETDEPPLSGDNSLAPQEPSVDTQLADDNVDTSDQMEIDRPASEIAPQPADTSDTSLALNPDGVGLHDEEQPATAEPQTAADIPAAEQSHDHTDADLRLPEEAAQVSVAEVPTVVDHRSPPLETDAIVEPMDVDMIAEVVADAAPGSLHESTQEGGSVPVDAERNEADLVVASTSASVAPEAEGEEELDDAMDVHETTEDVIAATPSALIAPDSAPDEPIVAEVGTPSTKNAPKSKSKPKSKAAGRSEAEKPASKKAATKEKPKSDKKGGQGSKAKTKVEDLKSSVKPRSASASESAHPASASVASQEIPAHREESVDPDDTAVYCVCRKPYSEEDEGEVMVACDACDNWYHPTCVGLSEDQLELVETYICKSCEGATAQRTVYKTSCKREECDNSVAGKASKFCSSACAFKHSMDVVAAISNKRSVKQLTATLSSYPAPVLGVQVINHLPTPPASPNRLASSSSATSSRKDQAAEALLESLQKQISATMAAIELVQRRQAILAEVTARAAMLVSATPPVNGDDTTGGGSKKSRRGGGGGDMGPCGWEPKLVWDDDEVRAWTGGMTHQGQLNGGGDDREGQEHKAEQAQPNGEGQDGAGQPEPQPAQSALEINEAEACLKNKRRCDRHSGWQKTVNAALELEERTLERRLQGLQDERDGVSRNLELDRAAQATRSLVGEKLQRRVVG